jgi:hypothetical protein
MNSLMIGTLLGSLALIGAWIALHYETIAEREQSSESHRLAKWCAGAATIVAAAGAIIEGWPNSQ